MSSFRQCLHTLLPACSNDTSIAFRELRWMLETVALRRFRSAYFFPRPSRPFPQVHSLSDEGVQHAFEKSCTDHERQRIFRWAWQRGKESRPLQYILGTQAFCGMDIKLRAPTLIPRWETEEWVTRLSSILAPQLSDRKKHNLPHFRILDLCTGTGCIAISLAHLAPPQSVKITAVDIADSAVALAGVNARRLLASNDVEVQKADITDDAQLADMLRAGATGDTRFDIVVCNPPYVSDAEYAEVDDDVRLWEDKRALVADKEGTALLERIAQVAQAGLLTTPTEMASNAKPAVPRLVMEIGAAQGPAAKKIVEDAGFHHVRIWKDMSQRDRCVVGY
ncbi:S-adenosyl-L-methionine-dependent methyltransferase [Fimicolochytrium jonesii]|uniref:S-adenosyl-L-methionine-dependent methyltransferase n=1 Tax=Fimicolochytrium jonesii TaxID=1396493 RepID=UPI0022FE1BCA|nr:S-adenosyl-L-methionine-dependent methyltransferase [Fimicolochytrium jonesii]KAI8823067.1 S-adenosyl-L-methionine-dependent methyltransferase [Fimicolochytrium jonesii]